MRENHILKTWKHVPF